MGGNPSSSARPDLIETFRLDGRTGTVRRLAAHLCRLHRSAIELGYRFDRAEVRRHLDEAIADADRTTDHKVRATLSPDGRVTVRRDPIAVIDERDPLSMTASSVTTSPTARTSSAETGPLPRVCLADEPIRSHDPPRRHKSTDREIYERHFALASSRGLHDALFLNERGQVAEASRHNVILRFGGALYTPPVSSGALPGVYRAALLRHDGLGLRVRSIDGDELSRCDALFLCNSVRGLVEVRFIG